MSFPEPLLAMSRLNSWVRSPSFRSGFYGEPRRAIYFLKRQAIEWADANLRCMHSVVKTKTTCRDCGGDGKYIDSYGYQWDHCRACNNRGTLSLIFVQSIISNVASRENSLVWHTPYLKFYIRHKPGPHWELARWTEWRVNEPGKDLTPAEAARDLNICESFWPDRRGAWESSEWGTFYHFDYRLYVGKTERKCSFCGGEPQLGSFGVTRGTIQWSDHACKPCETRLKVNGSIFEQFPVPEHLTSDSEIQLWMRRHEVIKAEVVAAKKNEAWR
jgi:hypothetical protein